MGPGKLQALVCCRICSVRKSGAWGGNSLWEGSWRRGRQGTTSWSPETATRWRSRKTYTKYQIRKRVIMYVYLSRRASPSGRLFVLRMISFEKSLGRLLAISAPTIQPQLCPTNTTLRIWWSRPNNIITCHLFITRNLKMINKLKEGGCMFGKTVLAPINPPEELLFSLVCHCLLTCRTGQSQSCQAQPTKSLQRVLVSPSAMPAVFVWEHASSGMCIDRPTCDQKGSPCRSIRTREDEGEPSVR